MQVLMQDNDLERLNNIYPDGIPEHVQRFYFDYQKAYHTLASGALTTDGLLAVAMHGGGDPGATEEPPTEVCPEKCLEGKNYSVLLAGKGWLEGKYIGRGPKGRDEFAVRGDDKLFRRVLKENVRELAGPDDET